MKVVIHINNASHQIEHAHAMKAGLARHGIACAFGKFDTPSPCDLAMTWGWRQHRVYDAAPVYLVMERGHLQDRNAFVACGFNGLGNNARYPKAPDGGARWRRHWDGTLKPWRDEPGAVLIFGQVNGDASNHGANMESWARSVAAVCVREFSELPVIYRPHPLTLRNGNDFRPVGTHLSRRTLAEDLADAHVAVGFTSTATVESTLDGVPTITMHGGSMAYPVTFHDFGHRVSEWRSFDREKWAHDLAWSSWSLDEIRDGTAWEALSPVYVDIMEGN